MPYKTDKISYGAAHLEYPKANVVNALDSLRETIHLDKEPVAITLLFTKEEFDAYPAEQMKAKAPYCVMVKAAAVNGKGVKTTLENHGCDGATTALALEPSTDEIESGRTYFSYNLYSSVATARRLRKSVKILDIKESVTYGVAIVPLSQCEKTPDVIISVCNPYQAMRMIQGYEYFTGVKPQIDMGAMGAMCSEATVAPYVSGEMNVSVMCPSTRMLCKWEESDLLVGIPYELFEMISEGVASTIMEY